MPRVVSIYADQAGTGKSTAAAYLVENYDYCHVSFAAPVKAAVVGFVEAAIGHAAAEDWMVERKEEQIAELGGASLVDLCCTVGNAIRDRHPGLIARLGHDRVLALLERGENVVIDDMRHGDEWDCLATLPTDYVKLTRTTNTNTRAEMEGLLADREFDLGLVIDSPQGDHAQLYSFLDQLAGGAL